MQFEYSMALIGGEGIRSPIPRHQHRAYGFVGPKNTVGIDYDGRAFHSTASALARDARRRNEIAPIRGFTHLSINAQEATDFIAFCRFADQARRALGIRSLDRCPRNNPTAAELEKRDAIERKQLDLWRKLICQSDFRKIE